MKNGERWTAPRSFRDHAHVNLTHSASSQQLAYTRRPPSSKNPSAYLQRIFAAPLTATKYIVAGNFSRVSASWPQYCLNLDGLPAQYNGSSPPRLRHRWAPHSAHTFVLVHFPLTPKNMSVSSTCRLVSLSSFPHSQEQNLCTLRQHYVCSFTHRYIRTS